MERYTAIVLAAGAGRRMNANIQKQYMALAGKPVLSYSLRAFEDSDVSDIILVVGKGEIEYCTEEIVKPYGIHKVSCVVEGGKERYHSVYEGLKCADGCDYVLIHDGARPFVTPEMINRSMEAVQQYGACVVGMPVKDTIKRVNERGEAVETPKRTDLWQIQTPQSFAYPLIREAYEKALAKEDQSITDDAMVVERYAGQTVRVIEGSYANLKITTPEDIGMAEGYLAQNGAKK